MIKKPQGRVVFATDYPAPPSYSNIFKGFLKVMVHDHYIKEVYENLTLVE